MKWYEARLIDLCSFGAAALLMLVPMPAGADQVTVTTQAAPTCWQWGGSGSAGQGQFSNCAQAVIVTRTVTKEVRVPGPVVIKEVVKEVPAKKIRE